MNTNANANPNPNTNGDYQVLRSHVEQARNRVHEERVDLAANLDELGEHHVRRKEYEDAMDAFTEALREKRSVFWNIGNCDVRNLPKLGVPSNSSSNLRSPRRKSKSNNRGNISHINHDDPNSDNVSAFSSSLLSGISTNYGMNTNGNASASANGNSNSNSDRDKRNDEEEDDQNDEDENGNENSYAEHARVHDATIDALVHTLRNIGNVHSLRGEQDEAMRYFTEVTTLRAQKLSNESQFESACQDADDASVETRSFLSGLGGGNSAFSVGTGTSTTGDSATASATNTATTATTATATATVTTTTTTTTTGGDENPALMSEINEDVKALDDLFRSISFRQGTSGAGASISCAPQGSQQASTATAYSSASAEKRKSKSSSRKSKKHKCGRSQTHMVVDTSEAPFVREGTNANANAGASANTAAMNTPTATHANPTSPASASNNGSCKDLLLFAIGPSSTSSNSGSNAAGQAMDKYRSTLDLFVQEDINYSKLRPHQEKMNSFALRIDLQQTDLSSSSSNRTQNHNSQDAAETRADLELALEIYRHVLIAYKEVSILSSSIHMDLRVQTSMPLQSSSSCSCSSTQQQQQQVQGHSHSQSILSMCSTDSSASSSVFSSQSSSESSALARTRTRKQSKRERRQQVAANIASVLICMGSVYYRLGNRNKELDAYKRAKSVYCKAFGEDHVFVAGTRKNIGMVLAERGQYDLAQKQFEKAMSIYIQQSKVNQEQEKQQEKMQQQQQQQEVAGTNRGNNIGKDNYDFEYNYNVSMNRDVASVISCIGNVKNRVGELDAALTKYLQALQIYKSIHERHTFTGNTRGNSNSSNNNNNDHVEALRDVTATLKVIGMVHAKRGDLDTAMQFFREAMALLSAYEENVDELDKDRNKDDDDDNINENSKKNDTINNNSNNNANTLTIRETMASVLTRIASIHLKKGELDDAMASYRQAYDLTVQNRGNTTNHPEIAGILHYIGGIYHKRGWVQSNRSVYIRV